MVPPLIHTLMSEEYNLLSKGLGVQGRRITRKESGQRVHKMLSLVPPSLNVEELPRNHCLSLRDQKHRTRKACSNVRLRNPSLLSQPHSQLLLNSSFRHHREALTHIQDCELGIQMP